MTIIEGESSTELRHAFMTLHALPLARQVFEADPEASSLVIAVAQYWCDEADDAVHIEAVPCTSANPTWPQCLDDSPFIHVESADGELWHELSPRGAALAGWEVRMGLPQLDENTNAITAFGAYCIEGSHQEMSMAEAYRPYAILRRDGDTVAVEYVGTMHQPQWEDRFDVGFDDEGEDLTEDAEIEIPEPAGSFRSFLQRIFGGS